MSATARVGTAMAAGYVLGRFKKLRLALIVGSAMSNKNVRASGLGLLQQGTKGLRGSPDALRISDQIKSRLIASGRAAAVGVAASRIDKLSDRLHERSDALRPQAADDDVEDDEYDEGDEPEDEYDDEPEDDEPEDETEDEEPQNRDPADDQPEDESEDEEPTDDDEEPDEPRRQHRSSRRRRAAAPVES